MSKGLEALKRLENDYDVKGLTLCRIIRQELERLEEYDKTEYSALIESHKKLLKEKKANKEKLKALEIIKKIGCIGGLSHTLKITKDYEDFAKNYTPNLTEDEYNLLKEVLYE